MRAIPLARSARRRHGLEPIVGRDGTLDAADAGAARRIAARLTVARDAAGEPAVSAGEVAALAAMDATMHRLIEVERDAGRADLGAAAEAVDSTLGAKAMADVDKAWRGQFREGESAGGPDLLAEVLVLAALNEDPAATSVRELVDDQPLRERTRYEAVVDAAERQLGGREAPRRVRARGRGRAGKADDGTEPRADKVAGAGAPRGQARGASGTAEGITFDDDLPLPARLREPQRRAPGSLAAQLRWVREHWSAILDTEGALARRIDLALDVLAEEARALELKTAGDHFGGPLVVETPDYRGLDSDAVGFSSDTEWMPSAVLMAKSTYVWLEQLARRFERPISSLADVPDEELDRLASLGVTGLWLIGLWERSRASAEIKRRRGDAEAVASAYAIDDYRIADDLGGEGAFEALKARSWSRGIRIAADMVPNHMGIDSQWVVEHPDRFISTPEPPYPAYTFTGPDLSGDDRVEITLEDHYWDNSDAAVVFRRRDRQSGEQRFIYHGNDGTSYPWNDTAQLDYLNPEVREAVIRTILDVARRAPILRFDAAMVLARRHVRRLWYPEPGAGGAIPSRAEHALSNAEFNRRMPAEFWREVVDRVAAEAPGTLLLAEAFWLLEGYFVRTLGMHRVYNSAFMHMLRDEDNEGYRRVMKDTLEFDPGVLGRFVNFLTNPDEKPAAEQFGTGDKAFSAATLLATLPGLPMLGHGQVEGLRERYGMEFRKARWDEPADEGHAGHFAWAIVPLLQRRAEFSGTDRFRLYNALDAAGEVVEDVYAYSNGSGESRSLVLVHHRHAEASVRIDHSVSSAQPGGGGPKTSIRLADALELHGPGAPADDAVIRLVDRRSGWELLRTAAELRREGLNVTLGAYEARVLSVEGVKEAATPTEPPPAKKPAAARPGEMPRLSGQGAGAARSATARRRATATTPSIRRPKSPRSPRRRP
ncbi:MAG TPA: alpha-amylase family glycosyl hydrolase [Candidatus Limnocylindria bacterium]|nr:alpha-amylase family glycosyl hydrolase [Candidatus Limnocylindria bacterium]